MTARRITLGAAATVAVLMVAHHPADYPPPADPAPAAATSRPASDPGCFEDEAAVVAPDPDPAHGLTWVCVALDEVTR